MASFITRRHLSRRAVLRGAGAALALPLLDVDGPSDERDAQAAGPLRRHLLPARRHHGALDAEGRRARLHLQRDPAAARAVSGAHQRHLQSGASARVWAGRRHGQSQPLLRHVPERREGGLRRAAAPRNHGGSDRGEAPGPRHAAAVAGAHDRGGRAQLRRRPQLRLPQHAVLAERDLAAADAEQSAGAVRAALRRRRERCAARGPSLARR